jgi:hypothetical protein
VPEKVLFEDDALINSLRHLRGITALTSLKKWSFALFEDYEHGIDAKSLPVIEYLHSNDQRAARLRA